MKQIHGIFAVTVTHFQENGEIDYAACAKHINWLIESGVHGLLPLGATGEFSALTLEERKAFAEFAMKEVAGRVPVIIGAVSTNVDVTLEVAKHAASIGADGVMILPPPGLHPSQDEIYAFYKHISENVTLPVMMGPTVWSTYWQGRLYAWVTLAWPVGSGWPWRAMSWAHSSRSCTPA